MSYSYPRGMNFISLTAIRILSLIAVFVAGYLAWVTFTHGTLAGCGDEQGHIACDDVLRSSWSRWVGVPVSIFGCAVYLLIFAATSIPPQAGTKLRDAAELALYGLVTLAVGSALWFLFLQIFVIEKFCLYCMFIHLCGITIALLLMVPRIRERVKQRRVEQVALLQRVTVGTSSVFPQPETPSHRPALLWLAVLSSIGLLSLVTGQILFPAKTFEIVDAGAFVSTTDGGEKNDLFDGFDRKQNNMTAAEHTSGSTATPSPLESSHNKDIVGTTDSNSEQDSTPFAEKATRRVAFLEGKLNIDVYRHPLLGSPAAEHVAVELVDYTCKDCRKMHQYVNQARTRYGGRIAFVVLPTPLEQSCNPYIQRTHPAHVGACKYAKLALAVSSIDRNKFDEFHDWLMESSSPPSLGDAAKKAVQLVGKEQLKVKVNGDDVRRRLRAHIRLHKSVRRFPAMILGDGILVGVPSSPQEFFATIEKNLRIKPHDDMTVR